MNLKCTYVLRRFLALFLLGYISLGAIGAENSVSDDRKVWQESDPTRTDYLSNRRALVGHGCTVNRFGGDGITVGQVQTNLENLCDEDLTNNATVPCVASVSVGYSPLVSVKDMGNVYARGTEAGFVLGGSSKVLGLDVVSIYEIRFYKDGELVAPEDAGPEYTGEKVSTDMSTGVSLSLITIGSDNMSREIHTTAPGDFDEIQLVQVDGIGLDVASAVQVKYAFAGKARQFNVTQDENNGMPAYSKYLGTDVKPWGKWNEGKWKDREHGDYDFADPEFQGYKLINTDLDDGAPIVVSALVSFMGNASVKGEAYDGSKAVNPFKAGTQIGFVINQESLLNVGVGTTAFIELTDVNDKKKTYNISTDVLELSLGKETGDATFSILSDMDFSEAKFYFAGLGIGAGEASAKYAFINLEPEKGNHHCSINPSADLDICDCDNHYKLSSAIDVTWSVKESPADAGDFTLYPETGEVAGLTTAGRYVFTATAADGCTEDVVINYGIPTGRLEETPLTNSNDNDKYEVMTGEGWGIDLLSNLSNANALVTPSIRDYAYYTGGVQLLSNKNIIGVKAKNGLISDGTKAVKAGFVISGGNNVLNAKLLDFLNIRLYKNGEVVGSGIIKDNSVLSTGLIGDENTQRVKFSVSVPAETEFDAMVLYTSGVLSLDLNQMNIYYAFIDETDGETDPLYGAKTVSFDNTGASIDLENTDAFNVVNIGSTPSEITNLIDNDMETAFTFPKGIGVANGTMIAVNIGRTVSTKQQVVMVTDNGNALLGLSLAEAFTIDLYRNGKKVASNNSSGFSVLGANVLGYVGTKGYIKITSPVEFDEIKFSKGEGLNVFNQFSIYGFALLNDYNGDGTPDQLDPEPCVQELVLDETVDLEKSHDYNNCRMILRRTFNGGKWNSLVLPVSLTEEQFHEAFGSRARLSEIDRVTTEGNNRIINFKTVQASADGTYLKENTPYIIYIEGAETEKHPADEQYESIEDGVVQGPIYIVNSGVDYQMENDKNTKIKVKSETPGLSYLGSYVHDQSLPIGCYIFSNGNLFHTSKEYQMKAYRCWIDYQTDDDTPLAKFSVNNTATGIDCITDNIENADSHIYNISGQEIENTDNLPEGIYIINGKKLIIK